MSATLLSGSELAKTMRAEIEAEVNEIKTKYGFAPTAAVVRAGDDAASISYSNALEKALGARGIGFQLHTLPETATQQEIVDLVAKLNADKSIHGIMVQEPLPKGIDEAAVKAVLSSDKDVDGVTPVNTGRLAQAGPTGRPAMVGPFFAPATPSGGMEILKRNNVSLKGKHAVIVGRSNIVGKPMALLLLRENASVTICHSATADLPAICRTADILCAAVGKANMIKKDWIKPGAIVIDFGVNFENDKMVGDVAFEEACEVAGMITPVPGGTGPMTNIMLMKNVIEAAKRQAGGK
ncbi:MAG: bifunctional 5,10-methylenetetrahydrofolate dehydrogenase/5,10-methenyltetrahydrofolate cyclohydrolase [Dehalococcoidales bacterium]|jgi:methylenetetrahydrofolate dehydrogenase (NADP+)/methenyltetrahydrofolate cyclohydrolase|nr:bifunctional 5,10-methylenetetrahydrofolate dehydrogenase/5,10-methenyltetrahydrofolate cyclohydrolase [Dehalococcoidales bacterium]